MQIKYLYIENFRNLDKFEWKFTQNEQNPITILLGKNGAGKSNLLEALLFIFRNLHYSDSLPIPFEYIIEYAIHGFTIKVTASEGSKSKYLFEIDGKKFSTKETVEISKTWVYDKQPEKLEGILPENVLVYYSGFAKRMNEYFLKTDEDYAKALRENKYFGFRPLFFYNPIHYRFILLGLFASPLKDIHKFLSNTLKIKDLEYFEIILQKPNWNKRKEDTFDNLWNAAGRVEFFFRFIQKMAGQPLVVNGKQVIFRFNSQQLKKICHNDTIPNEIELVKLLDAANLGGYISGVNIFFYKENVSQTIEFSHLSEGEHQLIAIRGAIELLRDRETLFLLDEPDTYLHPDWQREFIEFLHGDNFKDHYIMATHSPQSLSMVHKNNVILMHSGKGFPINEETFGQESTTILEDILGISRRPTDIQVLSDKYFKFLSENDLESSKKIRTKLERILDSNDPIFIKADAIIKRKQILGK